MLAFQDPQQDLSQLYVAAITVLGFETFLLAVVLAGVIQFSLGFAKAGTISSYFPSGVIEGMLTAIGIIIIKKELPHAIGYDKEHEGDFFSYELLNELIKGFFTENNSFFQLCAFRGDHRHCCIACHFDCF